MFGSAATIEPQTVVDYKGRRGVVVTDPWSVCGPFEVPVVFEGTTSFEGTPAAELTVVGPERPVADFKLCGAGTSDCCIFLVVGVNGPECQRFGTLRWSIVMRKSDMRAQREPTAMYPDCQLSARKP